MKRAIQRYQEKIQADSTNGEEYYDVFYELLIHYAVRQGAFIQKNTDQKNSEMSGVLRHAFHLVYGYWKSCATPLDEAMVEEYKSYENILLEDGYNVWLIQTPETLIKTNIEETTVLHRVIQAFFLYEPTLAKQLKEAIEKAETAQLEVKKVFFKRLEDECLASKSCKGAFNDFWKMSRTALYETISKETVKEIIGLHWIGTGFLQATMPNFQKLSTNLVAQEAEKLLAQLFTPKERTKLLQPLLPYYEVINEITNGLDTFSDQRRCLATACQALYNLYVTGKVNPYPSAISDQWVISTLQVADHLLEKHFKSSSKKATTQWLNPFMETGQWLYTLTEQNDQTATQRKVYGHEGNLLYYYFTTLQIDLLLASQPNPPAYSLYWMNALTHLQFEPTNQQTTLFGGTSTYQEALQQLNQTDCTVIVSSYTSEALSMAYHEKEKYKMYERLNRRVQQTYLSEQTSRKKRVQHLLRFYQWLTDRLQAEGIISCITYREAIDQHDYQGFRREVVQTFAHCYVIDLKETWAVWFFIKDKKSSSKKGTVHYLSLDETAYSNKTLVDLPFQSLQPDTHYNWINLPEEDFHQYLPLATITQKAALFSEITKGIKSPRDEWFYSFEETYLAKKVKFILRAYEKARKSPAAQPTTEIKWDNTILKYLQQNVAKKFQQKQIVPVAYRPFVKKYLYWDQHFCSNTQAWKMHHSEQYKTIVISATEETNIFACLATKQPVDDHFLGAVHCLTLYQEEDGSLVENITDEARQSFRQYYQQVERYFSTETFEKQLKNLLKASTFLPTLHKLAQEVVSCWQALLPLSYQRADVQSLLESFLQLQKRTKVLGQDAKEKKRQFTQLTKQLKEVQQAIDTLQQAFKRAQEGSNITKEAIFHYTYAVLHYPAYRQKYERNLQQQLPHIPFYLNFQQWVQWGTQLADLHINYEEAAPYELTLTTNPSETPAKVKLKAYKQEGIIQLDEYTQLTNIPAEVWRYRLGRKSALEWVLSQYKPRKTKYHLSKFAQDPFEENKEEVIDLLKKVCTVSVQTMQIIEQLFEETLNET